MVVRYHQAIVVFREVGEGKGVENFIWKGRDDRWLGQVFNCSLYQVSECHNRNQETNPEF